jgi:hypothetical protein
MIPMLPAAKAIWRLIMSLFDWFKNQFSHDAVQRTRLPIAKDNDLTGRSGILAQAEQHYVRLYFSELFLQKDQEWFTFRFPLGYSLIAHKYGDQAKVEFSNVAGKNKFDIQQARQDRSVLRNYAMTPLLPFRGGDIEVDCGLVSMEAGNLLESFAKTVGDIAGRLNVPQASAVVNVASSIAAGVQELLGAGKAKTVLYVHDMFTGKSLISGYLLLASNPLRSFEGQTIWMTDDGIRVGPGRDALAPIDPQDFLVVFVECLDDRDDWQSLSAIGKPLDNAIQAKLSGKDDEAKLLLVQAKVAAMTSPDLTRRDGKRVVAAIDAYYKDSAAIQDTIATLSQDASMETVATGEDQPSLHLARAIERLPVAASDKLPEIGLESLF